MLAQPRAVVLGALWLLVLALLIGGAAWLFAGCVVPFLDGTEPDYVILLPPVTRLAASCFVAFVLLSLAHAIRARRRPREPLATPPQTIDWPSTRYLTPLLLLSLPLVAVAILATPMRRYAAPWLYAGLDMRWWLLAGIAVLLTARFLASTDLSTSRRAHEISLAVLLAAASLLDSPRVRFQSVLVGDEPKYLRYLENWYRGEGMEVARLGPIADLPPGSTSDLDGNVRLLGAAISDVVADLVADSRRRLGLSAPSPPGPAKSEGGWFVEGKRGGIYQVHNPGISLLLFPGYLVDRAFGGSHDWHPQFPTNLYGTGATVLMLYVFWGVAVFRLLSSYSGNAATSWLLTAVVFLSLPVTAFSYQYYPEVAAGLLIAVLFRYGLLSADSRPVPAAGYGVLAGYLPWLHLRFMPIAIAAAVVVAVTRRRDRSAVGGFAAGLMVPLLALGAYYYHVTGSLMPWAMYSLAPDAALFSAARAWRDLPAFWLDGTWGLIAHSPVYLFALPGLWLSWRKSKSVALAIAVAVLAIAIPAAGHGYTGAFTTPLRLVAAVVPLLALPLADATIAFGASPWVKTALTLLGVISVQTGLTYNAQLVKSEASLQGASISGWMFPLLLPDFDAPSRLTQPLTLVWIVVTAGLLAYPFLQSPTTRTAPRPDRAWSATARLAALIAAFAAIGSVAGAWSGERFRPAFVLRAGDARDRIVHFALTEDPGLRWSTQRGWVDLTSYFPNPEGTQATLQVRPDQPRAGAPVEVAVDVRRPGNRPGWGTAIIDFGDGSAPVRVPVEGSARATHAYARPGDHELRVEIALWGLPSRVLVERFRIGER